VTGPKAWDDLADIAATKSLIAPAGRVTAYRRPGDGPPLSSPPDDFQGVTSVRGYQDREVLYCPGRLGRMDYANLSGRLEPCIVDDIGVACQEGTRVRSLVAPRWRAGDLLDLVLRDATVSDGPS
jgi:hypothetical protein